MGPGLLNLVALGLAAIALVAALVLCRQELRHRSQTHARLQTVRNLMACALVLLLTPAGLDYLKQRRGAEAHTARIAATPLPARAGETRQLYLLKADAASGFNRAPPASTTELDLLKTQNATLQGSRSAAAKEARATVAQLEQSKARLANSLAADPTLRSELSWQLGEVCKRIQKIRLSLGDASGAGRCAALVSEDGPSP